jgi:oligopeptide/dipeptide ABC transporter ATP-binding protein
VDPHAARARTIGGTPPSLLTPPSGCRFHPRCPHVMEICRDAAPPLKAAPDGELGHATACHLEDRPLREGATSASVLSSVP